MLLCVSSSTFPKKVSNNSHKVGTSAPAVATSSISKPSEIMVQTLGIQVSSNPHGTNSLLKKKKKKKKKNEIIKKNSNSKQNRITRCKTMHSHLNSKHPPLKYIFELDPQGVQQPPYQSKRDAPGSSLTNHKYAS